MALITEKNPSPLKLDMHDKKIMFHLSQNFRMPEKKLAKQLKISPQRAHYKIERLKKEVMDPAAFLNFPLLDIPSYIIYTPQLTDKTIDKLMKSEEVYFFMQGIGKYHSVLNVITEDIEKFCEDNLGEYLLEILPIKKSVADNYNPFNLTEKYLPDRKDRKIELDKKDYKILESLGKNPLNPLSSIKDQTGIDNQTIKKRIMRLWDSNIIEKFRYGINIFKIGFLVYTLRIKATPSNKKALLSHLRSNNYSGFIFETYEGFTMHYLPPSHKELFEFIEKIKGFDKNAEIDVIQNTEIYKINMVPKSVLNIFKKRYA